MVVVMNVIMHARFERINAIGPFELEVLGFQGAEVAFNRRVVKAVTLATHALLDSASHEHRSVGPHLVVPTLFGMHDQACDAIGPRERGPKHAGNHLERKERAEALSARANLRRGQRPLLAPVQPPVHDLPSAATAAFQQPT